MAPAEQSRHGWPAPRRLRWPAFALAAVGAPLAILLALRPPAKPPAPAPPPTSAPAPARAGLALAFVGDVLPIGVRDPFRHVAGQLRSADIAFCNLECPLSTRGRPTPYKMRGGRVLPGAFIFRARPAAAEAVAGAGIDVVSLANNHTMDYGAPALEDTLSALDAAGVSHAGAGRTLAEARAPAVVERKGWRVAYLAYMAYAAVQGITHFSAGAANAGVAFIHCRPDPGPRALAPDAIDTDIAAARRQADVVVVSFHWGNERQSRCTPTQQSLARRAIDGGADIVIGHHPHCLQGAEIYHGRPIFYSLGNFVFTGGDVLRRQTGIAWVRLSDPAGAGRPGIAAVGFRPAWIRGGRPELPTGREARRAAETLSRLTAALGTTATVVDRQGCPIVVVAPGTGAVTAAVE